MVKNTWERYQDGETNAKDALAEVAAQISMADEHLNGWQEQMKALRVIASNIVEVAYGGKAAVEGFGKLEITSPSLRTSYKKEKVDAVLAKLAAENHPLAAELAQAREESAVMGSLRITRSK